MHAQVRFNRDCKPGCAQHSLKNNSRQVSNTCLDIEAMRSIFVVLLCCSLATSYALPTTDDLLTIEDPTLFESETHSHSTRTFGHAHALYTQTTRSCTEQIGGSRTLSTESETNGIRHCNHSASSTASTSCTCNEVNPTHPDLQNILFNN